MGGRRLVFLTSPFFHCWPALSADKSKIIVKKALLAFAPYLDETKQDSKTLMKYIKTTYEWYGRNAIIDIIAPTLDNTHGNPKAVKLISLLIKFIGARCHHAALACRKEIKEDAELGE